MSEHIQNEKQQKDTLTDYLLSLPGAELTHPFE